MQVPTSHKLSLEFFFSKFSSVDQDRRIFAPPFSSLAATWVRNYLNDGSVQ